MTRQIVNERSLGPQRRCLQLNVNINNDNIAWEWSTQSSAAATARGRGMHLPTFVPVDSPIIRARYIMFELHRSDAEFSAEFSGFSDQQTKDAGRKKEAQLREIIWEEPASACVLPLMLSQFCGGVSCFVVHSSALNLLRRHTGQLVGVMTMMMTMKYSLQNYKRTTETPSSWSLRRPAPNLAITMSILIKHVDECLK